MKEGIPVPERPRTGREKVLPTLIAICAAMERIEVQLAEALAHPRIEIREWKPDHRRCVDGGRHVNDQRREVRQMARRGEIE